MSARSDTAMRSTNIDIAEVAPTTPDTRNRVYRFAYLSRYTKNLVKLPIFMTYDEAVVALRTTGAANSLATPIMEQHRGLWGIYTYRQDYARTLAMTFGETKPPRAHNSGFYGHYHDGKTHSFHIWFGSPVWAQNLRGF